MPNWLFPTLHGYQKSWLSRDLKAGVITAAVSIPISMGYAQIAGLQPVYGLYGSVFPILLFAMFSTSRQYIFGVDAAPAAIAGASLAAAGLTGAQAATAVPVLTLFTALWLFVFFLFRGGKLVNYISTPVMGGFLSGICTTVILMQCPKLLGGTTGHGELFELAASILAACRSIHPLSLALGAGSLVLLFAGKRWMPKLPVSVLLMLAGAAAEALFHLGDRGVALLPAVSPGLPAFFLPQISLETLPDQLRMSLPVAVVILAETLLAENNFAIKNGDRLDKDREILAFATGNLAAALTGCCAVNGSVSRTAMAEQNGMQSQLASVVAALSMVLVLLVFPGFIGYLPVPVLTAIVIAALSGVVEFGLARRLRKVDRFEYVIFWVAFAGVLLLGTVYGVLIGVLLSFVAVVLRSASPPRSFLGVIEGREGFYSLGRNRLARPIAGVALYRFSGSLFFANIGIFQSELEQAAADGAQVIIVDASGVSGMDITAADRLGALADRFRADGIRFYITEHIGTLNDRMRALGLVRLIDNGTIRRTTTGALAESGYAKPYPPEGQTAQTDRAAWYEEITQDFEWAFGKDANHMMERHLTDIIDHLDAEQFKQAPDEDAHPAWRSLFDEDALLSALELHTQEISEKLHMPEEEVERSLDQGHLRLARQAMVSHPEVLRRLIRRRAERRERLRQRNPELARRLEARQRQRLARLRRSDPDAADLLEAMLSGAGEPADSEPV